MIYDDLEHRFGAYVAELVRQALSLREFQDLEVEELGPYFALRAERVRLEYQTRLDQPMPEGRSEDEMTTYLGVLRTRWEKAEDLANLVIDAEQAAEASENAAAQSRA